MNEENGVEIHRSTVYRHEADKAPELLENTEEIIQDAISKEEYFFSGNNTL